MSTPTWSKFMMHDYCSECQELDLLNTFYGCCPRCGCTEYSKVPARTFGYWRGISAFGYVKLKHEIRHP